MPNLMMMNDFNAFRRIACETHTHTHTHTETRLSSLKVFIFYFLKSFTTEGSAEESCVCDKTSGAFSLI